MKAVGQLARLTENGVVEEMSVARVSSSPEVMETFEEDFRGSVILKNHC